MLQALTAHRNNGARRAIAVHRRWVVALAVTLVLVVGTVAALMLTNVHRLDAKSKEASIGAMREGLDERRAQLDRVVRDAAWSNEVVEAINSGRDRSRPESHLGSYLYGTYQYDWAFVIAPDGSTIDAMHAGETVADDITKALGNDIWRPLVERSRGLANREPQAVSAYLRLSDGGLGIGSAAAIMPETSWAGDHPFAAPYVLVCIRRLDADWFMELASALKLKNLSFSLSGTVETTGFQLAGPDGRPIGSVSWQARRPGTEYLLAIVPTLAVAVVLLLAMIWLGWQVGRAAPR